ncbi:MAG: cytochrome c family protein [Alphaproteobacteria bacterium]|nr:cytochrome c family protein [Alphaproteobacteria bacterium]
MKHRTVKVIGLVAALAAFSAPALADGDADAGKKVFNKCKACHTLAEGKNKVGPSLFGVLGKSAASVQGFKYSKALKESGLTWDEETLEKFLTKPKDLVPGTRMAFAGLKKDDDIENVVAYIKANGG